MIGQALEERSGGNRMVLEILSRPENVGPARVAVAAFAGLLDYTLAELEEIKIAVSEAVSNAVIHGYGEEEGMVRVEAEISPAGLVVLVQDTGKGIDGEATPSEDPERMGLGFIFMESFMDKVEVETVRGGGTRVRLEKAGKLVCRENV